MIRKKRILVSPLNWGLGHATRCIPIIRELIDQGAEVMLAAEGRPKALLKEEFPELTIHSLPGYKITYPKDEKMTRHMLKLLPKIFGGIIKEHNALNKIVDEYQIDGIISDNRYGLYTKKVKTAIVTHQLAIQTPSFKKIVNVLSHWFLKRFDECWTPDYPDSLLGMDLSSNTTNLENHKYIGPISRFSQKNDTEEDIDLLVVISGPEPQRTLFEEKVLTELQKKDLVTTVVLGKTEIKEKSVSGNLTVHNFLNATELEEKFNRAKVILARSGYSTLMDIERKEKKAILVPTPGQPEQEYLAEQIKQKQLFVVAEQNNLDIEQSLQTLNSGNFEGYGKNSNYTGRLLSSTIHDFLKSIAE